LTAALAEVDRRETAAAAAEAATQRQADEKRFTVLQGTCNAAGAEVVALAAKLADAIATGSAASQEAVEVGRKLDVSTVTLAGWTHAAAGIVSARGLRQGSVYARPGELEAAERAIAGRQ